MIRNLISPEASTDPVPGTSWSTRWAWVAPWTYALVLALWAASWNLRYSAILEWLPVDPVAVAAVALALCVVHRIGQPLRIPPAVTAPLLLLIVCFLPGALMSGSEGHGPVKVATMIFVLLPVVCAATILLDQAEARRGWVWAQLLVGVVVALAVAWARDSTGDAFDDRLTLGGLDTITTARLVGAAVVALALLGLTSLRRAWWALPLAAAGGAVLVQVGSRGPLLSMLLTVLALVLVGRCFAGRRIALMLGTAAFGLCAFLYASRDGGAGGSRIVGAVQTGFSDVVRSRLLADAYQLGWEHPWGIGWGDFALASDEGRKIANDQGVAYAHNAFGEAFSEGGVLAVVAFGVVVVLALHRLWRLSGDPFESIVLGTVVYWLLNAQVSSDLVGNRFMWIGLACGLAAYADAATRKTRLVDKA